MSERSKVEHYLAKAQECEEIARRMSFNNEREQMLELARDWTALAERADRTTKQDQ